MRIKKTVLIGRDTILIMMTSRVENGYRGGVCPLPAWKVDLTMDQVFL